MVDSEQTRDEDEDEELAGCNVNIAIQAATFLSFSTQGPVHSTAIGLSSDIPRNQRNRAFGRQRPLRFMYGCADCSSNIVPCDNNGAMVPKLTPQYVLSILVKVEDCAHASDHLLPHCNRSSSGHMLTNVSLILSLPRACHVPCALRPSCTALDVHDDDNCV